MTHRSWLLVTLICILVVAGLASRSGAMIALALPLLLYLMTSIASAPGVLELDVSRTVSTDRASYRKPVSVQLEITNRGGPLAEVELVEVIQPGLPRIDGVHQKRITLQPGEETRLDYTAYGRRGIYQFVGVQVTANDPFGLFSYSRLLPAPAHLIIFPEVSRLRPIQIRPHRTHGFAGPIPARKAGSGADFFGVREYQPGDALGRINWSASTRRQGSYEQRQDLFTNEFEQESIADVGLILDAREQSHISTSHGSLFEHSVQATASLVDRFICQGHRVGLLIYGFGLTRVFPGYGPAQSERILQTLACAQTGKDFVMESLNYLPTRFFPSGSQLVLVSPLLPADVDALIRFRALGYSLLIVSPDPLEFELQALSGPGYVGPALKNLALTTRLARAERNLMLHQLKRVGIQVVNWNTEQPLDAIIQAELAQQPLRRLQLEARI